MTNLTVAQIKETIAQIKETIEEYPDMEEDMQHEIDCLEIEISDLTGQPHPVIMYTKEQEELYAFGASLFNRSIEPKEEEVEPEVEPSSEEKQREINFHIYSEKGKAFYRYDGPGKDGKWITVKAEFKSRNDIIKIAQRVVSQCNSHKATLSYEHGYNDLSIGLHSQAHFCLSNEAEIAVIEELKSAKFQRTCFPGGWSNHYYNFSLEGYDTSKWNNRRVKYDDNHLPMG